MSAVLAERLLQSGVKRLHDAQLRDGLVTLAALHAAALNGLLNGHEINVSGQRFKLFGRQSVADQPPHQFCDLRRRKWLVVDSPTAFKLA